MSFLKEKLLPHAVNLAVSRVARPSEGYIMPNLSCACNAHNNDAQFLSIEEVSRLCGFSAPTVQRSADAWAKFAYQSLRDLVRFDADSVSAIRSDLLGVCYDV